MSTQSDQSLKVADVMLTMDACPVADERTILKEVLEAMDKHRLGVVCIVDKAMNLTGILTEGDVRRKLLRVQKPLAALLADDVITHANAAVAGMTYLELSQDYDFKRAVRRVVQKYCDTSGSGLVNC